MKHAHWKEVMVSIITYQSCIKFQSESSQKKKICYFLVIATVYPQCSHGNLRIQAEVFTSDHSIYP